MQLISELNQKNSFKSILNSVYVLYNLIWNYYSFVSFFSYRPFSFYFPFKTKRSWIPK